MSFLAKIFGDDNKKAVSLIQPIVAKVNEFEAQMSRLSLEEIKLKTESFRKRLLEGETLDDILPEAYALVREAAKRTLGERHYDVQLIGGVVLHHGKIAEMRTGEGKTLVVTSPAYLNAISKKGVHVVTVNDYLSRRDAVWMGQIYNALGLSVGVVNHDASYIYDPNHQTLDKERDDKGSFHVVHEFLRPCTRREAYEADITYGTNNEFGFDYLRDNLEYEEGKLRQRDFNFAIVDEIDSILIDEARTPLIIASATSESEDLYKTFASLVKNFKEDEDYTIDRKFKSVILTETGIAKAEKSLGIENIYTDRGIKMVHHLETAVKAKAMFSRDKEYVVRDGQVIIVDEFTGRMQPGRRWSEGLHQAIEAKEGVVIQKESRTFASITFQNYFRLYKKLAGCTGTALTSQEEFMKVYNLDTVAIPTNKPLARKDLNDQIFQTEAGKFKAVARKVKELNQKGQPVLVGTVSIEKNEILSSLLKVEGVKHEVLNAKNHEREGEIIAQAGRRGGVTIATNMAGRGVDIKLGGNPATEEARTEIRNLGGLFVLGTERHEARRIDNQLRGRSGRQGDPGETQFFISLEDDLMRVFPRDTMKSMMSRLGVKEDEPIENRMITRSIETAQTKIEGFNFDARKHVLEYDDVMNYQRKIVYERRRKILLGKESEIDAYLEKITEGRDANKEVVQRKKEELKENFYPAIKQLVLQTIDMFWVDHLEAMDYMRGSVNLRAYGQRDPLVEYKKEGLRMFKDMEAGIAENVLKVLVNFSPNAGRERVLNNIAAGAKEISGDTNKADQIAMNTSSKGEVGRNDPCPCGSGKKYKKCHGVGK
jgi:preprotein translocase subunit SecA